MSSLRTESALSQPGWYPDPYGTGSLRWWDGRNWSDRLNPEPAAPGRAPLPRRRPSDAAVHADPRTAPQAAPHAPRRPTAPGRRRRPSRRSTSSSTECGCAPTTTASRSAASP
ncbi:DUF2510 domain-containing protein [Actinomadura sp. WAC 06369]|uniref:DUF2510 domain-containing protein n=1 Tax=Actinomadura sp. WAC 06369 TaxID=2203193 RepID=UPI0010016BDB|nr:hypothetical protein DMH08_05035 [Actinomadura sp. WAC 06369]